MDKELRVDLLNRVEAWLEHHPNKVIIEPIHHFAPGIYMRDVVIPAGTTLISEVHKTEHFWMVLKGSLSVWVDNEVPYLIGATDTGITLPGTRRFAHAHEEVIWRTVHANPSDTRDLDQLHDEIIQEHTNPYLVEE